MFSLVGHYIGFTGYYNPFTAEAQLNYTVPVFIRPFIVTHEIAHQLGYAKENEASFVAYLTCSRSGNNEFLYSVYFELFRNTIFELRKIGAEEQVRFLMQGLHPRAVADNRELEEYLLKNRNIVEPFFTTIYDRYLKLNNQPKGKATYNEVLLWLLAYLRSNGMNAL